MIDKSAASLQPVPPRPITYLGDEIPLKEAVAQSPLITLAKFTSVSPGGTLSTYGVLDYEGKIQITKVLKGHPDKPAINVDFTLNSYVHNDAVPQVGQEWILFAKPNEANWIITKMLPLTPATLLAIQHELEAPQPATSTAPAAQAPPYSDEQAQAFAAKLPDLKYPTEIAPACQSLRIDPARLAPNGLIKSSVNGMSGQSWTRLSPNYYISFQFGIAPKYSGITRVVIYQPKLK